MSSSKPYRNVVGLSQAKLEELLKNFEKLKDFGVELHDRVVRYVLDGDDEACWASWRARPTRRSGLGLICVRWLGPRTIRPIGENFLASSSRSITASIFAWARSSKPLQKRCGPTGSSANVVRKTLWLEILLQEATGRTRAGVWRTAKNHSHIRLIDRGNAEGRWPHDRALHNYRVQSGGKKRGDGKARGIVLAVTNVGMMIRGPPRLLAAYLLNGPPHHGKSRSRISRETQRRQVPLSRNWWNVRPIRPSFCARPRNPCCGPSRRPPGRSWKRRRATRKRRNANRRSACWQEYMAARPGRFSRKCRRPKEAGRQGGNRQHACANSKARRLRPAGRRTATQRADPAPSARHSGPACLPGKAVRRIQSLRGRT